MERYDDIQGQEETWAMALAREKTIREELIRERLEERERILDKRLKILELKEQILRLEEEILAEKKKMLGEDKKRFEKDKKMIMDRARIEVYLDVGLSYEEISGKMNLTIEEIYNIINR